MFAPVTADAVAPIAVEIQSNLQAEYESAVRDRIEGRYPEAATKLERILSTEPGNADARLNLGLVRLAQGRLDDAERELRRVLNEAPGYADAREGLIQVQRRRQVDRSARIDVDYAKSTLSAGLPDWNEVRVNYSRTVDQLTNAGFAVEYTERFGNEDLYVEGRVSRRFGEKTAFLAFGGTGNADYRPQVAIRAGVEGPLSDHVTASLDSAVARFATGSVATLQPGATISLLPGKLQLSGRWINTWDENDQYRSGYAVWASYSPTDRMVLRLSYADAPETSEGVTIDVKATSLAVEFSVGEATLLRLGGAFEDRGAYDRRELSMGIGRRF